MSENVVVITGCSTGIGRALALEFHARKMRVVATARKLESLSALAEAGMGTVALDVNDGDSVSAAVKQIVDAEGRIDMLVNNAGVNRFGPVLEQPMEELRQIMETNVLGLIAMTQAVFPHMADRRSGHIINIGSVAGVLRTPWAGAYCASKAAVHMVSDVMRLELAPFGVHVTVVQPGAVRSSIVANAESTARYKDESSRYSGAHDGIELRANASQVDPMEAEDFARSFVDQVCTEPAPRMFRLGAGADTIAQLAQQPVDQVDMMVSARFGLAPHSFKP